MKLYDIDNELDQLLIQLGLNSSTQYYRHAEAEIATIARMQEKVPVHFYSAIVNDGVAIALSRDKYLLVTKDEITVKDNGDGVLFMYPGKPWKFTNTSGNCNLFNNNKIDSFIAGVLSGNRVPILLVTGEKQTGKTTLAKLVLAVINGSVTDVQDIPKSSDDMKVVLAHDKIVCFDNLESAPPYFHDIICMAVTGATNRKRKLYTDSGISENKLDNAFIVTAINPSSMIRDDVVSRMIVVKTDKIVSFENENNLFDRALNSRNEYLSHLVLCIQKSLSMSPSTKHRMTGWATVAQSVEVGPTDFDAINNIGNRLVADSIHELSIIKQYLDKGWGKHEKGMEFYNSIRQHMSIGTKLENFPKSWRELAVIIRRHADIFQKEIGLTLTDGHNVTLVWGTVPHENDSCPGHNTDTDKS
jgi:hypothetical protein